MELVEGPMARKGSKIRIHFGSIMLEDLVSMIALLFVVFRSQVVNFRDLLITGFPHPFQVLKYNIQRRRPMSGLFHHEPVFSVVVQI